MQIIKPLFTPFWVGGLLAVCIQVQAAPVGSIEERIERLERMADNPVLLQMNQRLMDQQREIQRLHDEMDRLKRDQRNLRKEADERYAETDERISRLENRLKAQGVSASPERTSVLTPSPGAATAQPDVKASQAPADQPVKTHPATPEEEAEYQKAFALMRAAQYGEAIQAFEGFVKRHPNSALASNASYWSGEGNLINKSYEAALQAFERVLKRYPDSAKVADAMLRAGDALMNLKQRQKAHELYQKLIQAHPKSRAAERAQERLSE